MSAEDFEQPAAPTNFGRQLRQAYFARLQANADMAATVRDHEADSAILTAGQHGIFGSNDSPQQQAQQVAARAARVGDGAGAGRELETWGGVDFESQGAGAVAPVPARRDLRFVDQHQPPGISPLLRHMQGLD